jgi:hypothetical protein
LSTLENRIITAFSPIFTLPEYSVFIKVSSWNIAIIMFQLGTFLAIIFDKNFYLKTNPLPIHLFLSKNGKNSLLIIIKNENFLVINQAIIIFQVETFINFIHL